MGKNKQKKNEAAEAVTSSSNKMSGKEFEKELAKLQVELVRLQTWVQAKKARVIVVFEGRDTAGKGGVISRITERTSPRVFRHVALPAPSDKGLDRFVSRCQEPGSACSTEWSRIGDPRGADAEGRAFQHGGRVPLRLRVSRADGAA